jgi:predicted amidohydrolase
MSVRALENGVWIAASDKVGMERGAVVYAGQSCVIAPDGSVAAMATTDGPEIIWADIDLAEATGPPVPRRPELYGPIAAPHIGSEAESRLATPVDAARSVVRLGLLQSGSSMDAAALGSRFANLRTTARALRLGIVAGIVTAETSEAASLARSVSGDLKTVSVIAAADEQGRMTALHVSMGGAVTTAGRTHGSGADLGGVLEARTWDVGPLRVGALVGPEGLVPEVCRIVTLQGAELLLWAADADTPRPLDVARVRAVENRVWVGIIVPTGSSSVDEPLSALVDPDGRVVAIGLRGRDHLVAGTVNVATARLKQMAPGTDVLQGRQPDTYAILTDVSAVRT